jgi:hypothetical protein
MRKWASPGKNRRGDHANAFHPIGFGCRVGLAVGVSEVLVRMSVHESAVTHHHLLEAAMLYAAVGIAIALALRGAAFLLRRPLPPKAY